jgi:DNA polymerase-3 subunit gamma/tau
MAKPKPAPAPEEQAAGYTVLARRYRPQTFTQIVGQDHVARALGNALQANRVAHAYLFTGNRGVGKTSTARILAKALNCEQGPTPSPCGKCPMCLGIASGDDVDVLEIDGASNRRIDEIRDIRSNVQYRPSRSRYKIYIIDEVHMLTKEAFNALLKTLEEPPPHVKFIFATTEVEKVPITILSRCQRFDFAGIPTPRIVEHLREVLRQEGREADDEALERIARRAGGSMRDAQSILDQLLAFGGERLSAEEVHQLLGTAQDDRIIALAGSALAGEAKQALVLFDKVAAGGLQMGELLDQLLAYWRDLLVLHAGAGELALSVPPRHRETLEKHAGSVSLDTLLAGLDILANTRSQLRGSAYGRTLVEMALVRLGRLENLVSLAQLGQLLNSAPTTEGSRSKSDQPSVGPGRHSAAANVVTPPETGPRINQAKTNSDGVLAGPIALTAETLPTVWTQTLSVLATSGLGGKLLAGDLEKAGIPAISGPNTLVLSVPTAYNRLREELGQDADRLQRVEEALRKACGKSWTLRIESTAAHPVDGSGPPGVGEQTSPPTRLGEVKRNPKEEAEKLPLIKRAMTVLGASIHRVDESFGAGPTAHSGTEETPLTEEEP